MLSTKEIYEAFAKAPRPSAAEVTTGSPGDLERLEIVELLSPYEARDVPDQRLGEYPLYTMFPFLSPVAYRYYLPRCIEFCLNHPHNELAESLLFSLSDTGAPFATFLPEERRVVREYLEQLSRTSNGYDAPFIERARQLWL